MLGNRLSLYVCGVTVLYHRFEHLVVLSFDQESIPFPVSDMLYTCIAFLGAEHECVCVCTMVPFTGGGRCSERN